jgi:hypothetical protein
VDRKRVLKNLARVAGAGTAVVLVGSLGLTVWIGHDVADRCSKAKAVYGGDCVQALISQLDDDTRDLHSRNDATWALGQLGDSRALPIVRKYYSGWDGEPEPLDVVLSQYQLKKALEQLEGEVNLGRSVWKFAVD